MLKVIGAGLSRTGTTSLCEALKVLGLNCAHYEPHRLKEVMFEESSNFKVFDDIDAITDTPVAHFHKEILASYPGCKVILTIRDDLDWYESICRHYLNLPALISSLKVSAEKKQWLKMAGAKVQELTYGSCEVSERYLEVYRTHNKSLVDSIEPERILVMDVTKGDGWDKICHFLGLPTPKVKFPNINHKVIRLM